MGRGWGSARVDREEGRESERERADDSEVRVKLK